MMHQQDDDNLIPRLPVHTETLNYNDWVISYNKSHILKSMCSNDNKCLKEDAGCCDLCRYHFGLELPSLPEMVFHKNWLRIEHKSGGCLEFNPMDALKSVRAGRLDLKVACAEEWRESRPEANMEEKIKPFDWTFTTEYRGTVTGKLCVEPTESRIDITKLMQREKILFYHDLTLFEDELHDHGVAKSSVKIRVMPSGFYVLLRFFLRVDNVLIRMVDTRYYYEHAVNYILREFTTREAKVADLLHVPPPCFIEPNDIEKHLPIMNQTFEKITITD